MKATIFISDSEPRNICIAFASVNDTEKVTLNIFEPLTTLEGWLWDAESESTTARKFQRGDSEVNISNNRHTVAMSGYLMGPEYDRDINSLLDQETIQTCQDVLRKQTRKCPSDDNNTMF